ncbi:MAG: zinc-ribbon domain-containing protein [Candidatus Thorarchaeota archaeon]
MSLNILEVTLMGKKHQFFWTTSLIMIFFSSILPVNAAEIDETITISAGTHRGYSFNVNYDNVVITLKIEVRSGNDINVYVMDEANYNTWKDGGSATGYLSRQKIGSFTTDVTLGAKGRYYIVLDNTYSIITSKSVYIFMEVKSGGNLDLLFVGGLIVLILIGISAFIFWKRSTKQRLDASPPMITSYPAERTSSTKWCPNCNHPNDPHAKFCEHCGQGI